MNDYKKVTFLFVGALLFVFSAVFGSALIDKVIKSASGEPTPTPILITQKYEAITCPKDVSAFEDLRKKEAQIVDLIAKSTRMFASNGKFINSQIVITKNETKDSKVACGYLFVKAHTDNGSLQDWENLYINPDNFGGHIEKSNQFGIGDGNNFSEYLFSLSEMKYWKSRNTRGDIRLADWSALLNVYEKVTFEIALNSQDRSGTIDKMSIAYKCWNPVTGEENMGCRLNVENKPDQSLDILK